MKIQMTVMVAVAAAALACGDRNDRNAQQSAAESGRLEARRDMPAEPPDVATPQDAAPTASDQPENPADRELAAAIRQKVVADDSLSTAAHNVTIVSDGGHVTLRGQVGTPDEKSRIEAAARETPGVNQVDNLIEVAQQ